MLTVDAYLHASKHWVEPIEVGLFLMSTSGIDKAIIAPLRNVSDPTRGTARSDNEYVLECARRFPGRFAVICTVDVRRPDALETVAHWHAQGAECLYLYPHDRSPGKDPLAIWRKAGELGMPVSFPGTPAEIGTDEVRKLVKALPEVKVMIEQRFGGGSGEIKMIRGGDWGMASDKGYRQVLALSKYPNVYMKPCGLGEFMPRPVPEQAPFFDLKAVPPVFIDETIDAFGANRIMFGSNFPSCSLREGYINLWRYLREYLARRSAQEQEWVFGKTAASLFSFGQKG